MTIRVGQARNNCHMIKAIQSNLGKGIYTPAEVAFYARVQTRTLNRWIFGNKTGESVLTPELSSEEDRTLTFLDLIQSLAIRSIRTKHDIPLQKIRDAVRISEERGISFPFARNHTTFLYGDGEVVLKINGDLIQASGRHKRNKMIKEVAQLYLKDLTFDDDGLASKYVAWESSGRKIVLNPKQRFGEPIVSGCGYSVSTLFDAYETEGSIENAAKAYKVKPADIEVSLEYLDHLMRAA